MRIFSISDFTALRRIHYGFFSTNSIDSQKYHCEAALTEYTNKKVKKATKTERPSVLAKLNKFKEMVKNAVADRTKRKELER